PTVEPTVRRSEGGGFEDVSRLPAPPLNRRELEQLHERFQPERAGCDRIFVEVCLEEPFVRIDLLDPAEVAETGRAAARDEALHPVDHPELFLRKGRLGRVIKTATPLSLSLCRQIRLGV